MGYGFEQKVQKDSLVTEDEGVEFVWESEHLVERPSGQELRLLFFEPLGFGARLTLGAVAVTAGNGELTITCLMGSKFLWGVKCRKCLVPLAD